MSNVIAFPKRHVAAPEPIQRFPPITPWPAWKYALRDRYWSRDNWRTSQKGNLYVVIDGRCITWFQKRDGWSWSISVSGSDDEPLWSKRLHASERDARTDAWDSLVTFYEGPKEADERTTP